MSILTAIMFDTVDRYLARRFTAMLRLANVHDIVDSQETESDIMLRRTLQIQPHLIVLSLGQALSDRQKRLIYIQRLEYQHIPTPIIMHHDQHLRGGPPISRSHPDSFMAICNDDICSALFLGKLNSFIYRHYPYAWMLQNEGRLASRPS